MRGIDPVSDNGEAVVRYNPDLRFTHSRVSACTDAESLGDFSLWEKDFLMSVRSFHDFNYHSPRLRFGLVYAAMMLSACGCGSGIKTYPVSGAVTLDSSEPLVGGTVSMVSLDNSISATATTDDQGRFSMGTLKPGDGVPPGTYRAVVLPPIGLVGDEPQPAPFDLKYTRYETSGLEFTVEGSIDDLTIHLE